MSSEHTLHAITELNQAFEAFKQANEERLNALEKKSTDPLAMDKVERLNTLMDQISLKLNQSKKVTQRPFLGQSTNSDELEVKAFSEYLLTGDKKGLAHLETKNFDTSKPEKGGVLLPNMIYEHIHEDIRDQCPLMGLAHVVMMDSGKGTTYRYPRFKGDANGFQTYWKQPKDHWGKAKGDGDGKGTPEIEMVDIPLNTIHYQPRISWDLMENRTFDLITWLETGISEYVGSLCHTAFINGDGQNQPKGLMNESFKRQEENQKYKIEELKTGSDAKFTDNTEYEKLLDVMGCLKARYAREASWLFSNEVMKLIRLIKSPDDRYLWSPNHTAIGQSSSLLGYPVTLCEGLSKLDDHGTSLFFGNFKQGYTIIYRPNMTIIRDEMTSKPDIELLMRYGYGGSVTDGEAIKALKFAA